MEWQRREWLSPHRDAVFSFFLIERGLYWAERPDPRHAGLIPIDHHNHANNNHHQHRINGKPLRGATTVADTVAWPALVSINRLRSHRDKKKEEEEEKAVGSKGESEPVRSNGYHVRGTNFTICPRSTLVFPAKKLRSFKRGRAATLIKRKEKTLPESVWKIRGTLYTDTLCALCAPSFFVSFV